MTHDDALAAKEDQILVLEVELLEVADALALEVVDLGALAALAVVVGQLGLGRVPRHVHPKVRHVLISGDRREKFRCPFFREILTITLKFRPAQFYRLSSYCFK